MYTGWVWFEDGRRSMIMLKVSHMLASENQVKMREKILY